MNVIQRISAICAVLKFILFLFITQIKEQQQKLLYINSGLFAVISVGIFLKKHLKSRKIGTSNRVVFLSKASNIQIEKMEVKNSFKVDFPPN